jgi:hypothetical protein
MTHLAWLKLAAGNEAGYRTTCADVLRRYGSSPPSNALVSIVLTFVSGEKAVPDMEQVLELARRAVQAEPTNPLGLVLLGAAEYRVGRGPEAIETLTQALAHLQSTAPATANKSDPMPIARLLGATFLALAYHDGSDHSAFDRQLQSLRTLVDQTVKSAPQHSGGLPPWTADFALTVAKRTLTNLNAPNEPSLDP